MAAGLVSKTIKTLMSKNNHLQSSLVNILGLTSSHPQSALARIYCYRRWLAKDLIAVGSLLNYRLAFIGKNDSVVTKFPSIEEVNHAESLDDARSITNVIKLQTALEGKRQPDLLKAPHISAKSLSSLQRRYQSGSWLAQDLLAIAAFFNYQLAYVDSNDKVVTKFVPDEQ